MNDVKWIKLSVGMPDNRKIKRIRRLPDGNNIILIWVFLLLKAAESNNKGGLFFLEDMPYTVEDLADEFEFSIDLIQFALKTLEKLSMIEIYDEVIYIKNWEKYQSVDKLEKIREQTRKRVAKHREKNALEQPNEDVTLHVTQSNATELELELDIELDKEKEVIPYVEIINYLNDVANKNYRSSTPKTKNLIKARWNEGFRMDDFKSVIDTKYREWKNDDKMSKFLRPETLFSPKFEGYLNQGSKQTDDYDNLF
ncbi:replication protein [Oceanobacillus arenosus]|uniref:Replication protein n=1 Tax=Oceanobacillus arenosus TaxID=1229153 RepID=A0A3D8PQS9_9BACI|nr:phage replisome organizer N-terminal domain-containing protein [Oceanobacillus arenosus]RDW17608.1 replication protein [Oceanobacillus arenosus]